MISSIGAGQPYRCIGRIARVRGVIAASISAGSILYVRGSMSTKTGVAPTMPMASVVATNVNGVVMTSSPGPMSSARSARCSASVPEFRPTPCEPPTYAATSPSSAFTFGPLMNVAAFEHAVHRAQHLLAQRLVLFLEVQNRDHACTFRTTASLRVYARPHSAQVARRCSKTEVSRRTRKRIRERAPDCRTRSHKAARLS